MPKLILIAEDEDNIALAFEFFVQRQGYRVRRVADGDAALAALQDETPDLVVLDIMLPGHTGHEICQSIRRDPSLASVRILIMTARGGKMERAKALAIGADAFLTKPFGSTELLAQIRELIGDAGP